MTILIIIGIFGITLVGVLLEDMLFGEKRTKENLEIMKWKLLKGDVK